MSLKQIRDFILDPGNDIQERLFLLVTSIALGAMGLTFLAGFFLGESMENQIVLAIGFAVFFVIIYLVVRFNALSVGAVVISVILIFLVLPLVFFTGGAIYGGSPLWFAFCAIYISMILKGRIKFVFLTLFSVMTVLCYYIAMNYPQYVLPHDNVVAYQDSLVSLMMTSILASIMIGFEIKTFQDENKRSEERGKKIDELNQAQNHFFSNMSHEIRTPINTIIGLNEMILREEVSDEVAEDAVNIQAASELLLNLINDVLDMSKIESGKMEITPVNYDFGKLISDIVGIMGIQAREKGLILQVDADPLMPRMFCGDEMRIKQILINLLTNSVKYTHEGNVTLAAQSEKLDDETVLLICSVSDTGVGIKKENIPYLFSAFKRVDEEKNRFIEGTGLGLSIVKQLVELMGGTVKVNSVYTKGSTFIIEIPQKVVGDERLGEPDFMEYHTVARKSQYRKRFEAPDASILAVDDNESNLLVVKKLLRDTGIKIETARNGWEALKHTQENRYDIIFMDHMMPVMDGIECLHRIVNQDGGLCRDSKIIALTANTGSENATLYRKEGFDGYLVKPVNGEALENEILNQLPRELIHLQDSEINAIEETSHKRQEYRKRTPIVITTESICDIPEELVRNESVAVLPYIIEAGYGTFLDGVEIDTRGVLDYASDGGVVKTIPPAVSDYETFFAEQLLRANNVIHITKGSELYNSGYNNALEAVKAFDNITVFDSGSLSCGTGMLVMRAVKLVRDGLGIEEVIRELSMLKKRICVSFLIKSMSRISKTGLVSSFRGRAAEALMAQLLVKLENGRMRVENFYFSSGRSSFDKFMRRTLGDGRDLDKSMLYVAYAGLSERAMEECDRALRKRYDFERLIFIRLSAAIAVNCGEGTVALIYMEKAQ